MPRPLSKKNGTLITCSIDYDLKQEALKLIGKNGHFRYFTEIVEEGIKSILRERGVVKEEGEAASDAQFYMLENLFTKEGLLTFLGNILEAYPCNDAVTFSNCDKFEYFLLQNGKNVLLNDRGTLQYATQCMERCKKSVENLLDNLFLFIKLRNVKKTKK